MTASRKDQQKQRRTQRLSAALRDNLKRRKAQARGRKVEDGAKAAPDASSTGTHDSAGISENKQQR